MHTNYCIVFKYNFGIIIEFITITKNITICELIRCTVIVTNNLVSIKLVTIIIRFINSFVIITNNYVISYKVMNFNVIIITKNKVTCNSICMFILIWIKFYITHETIIRTNYISIIESWKHSRILCIAFKISNYSINFNWCNICNIFITKYCSFMTTNNIIHFTE